MGRSTTPAYVVEIVSQSPPGLLGQYFTPMAWNVRGGTNRTGQGRPTDANLEKFVFDFGKSLTTVNRHISEAAGYIPYPTSATIRENRPGGAVLATWKAAMFQVW